LQLLERDDRRLVAEIVFAGMHDLDAERGTLIGNRGGDDELNGLVVEDLILAASELHIAEAIAKLGDLLRVRRIKGDELSAASLHGRGHAVDVRVVEPDCGEAKGMLRLR